MNRTHIIIAVAAVTLAALFWVDPLYLPLVALGPIVTGLVAGARGVDWRAAAAPWVIAALITLLIDLGVRGEDVAFHAAAAVFVGLSVALGTLPGALLRRRRAQPA